MMYEVIITDYSSCFKNEFKTSFITCSQPKINYCGGYLCVTGLRGFIKIGSNFSIEVKEVKE